MSGRPTPEAFAATYDPEGYPSAWDAVVAYSDWRLYQANHPDAGRHRTANALDMPAGRIRGWRDGGKPDVVRGLEMARDHGWISTPLDGRVFRGLNQLIAWIYAAGIIPESRERWIPRWRLNRPAYDDIFDEAATRANVEYVIRERPRQGREAEPRAHGNILGRVFVALGVPRGAHSDSSGALPPYLREANAQVRREFVEIYLLNAGTIADDEGVLTIAAPGSTDDAEGLVKLVSDVTRDGARVEERDQSLSVPLEVVEEVAPRRLVARR